jgi:hypothetical protein
MLDDAFQSDNCHTITSKQKINFQFLLKEEEHISAVFVPCLIWKTYSLVLFPFLKFPLISQYGCCLISKFN